MSEYCSTVLKIPLKHHLLEVISQKVPDCELLLGVFCKNSFNKTSHMVSLRGWYRIWSHGNDSLIDVLGHLNSIHPSIQFTIEKETNIKLPFSVVLGNRRDNGTFGYHVCQNRLLPSEGISTTKQHKERRFSKLSLTASHTFTRQNTHQRHRPLVDSPQHWDTFQANASDLKYIALYKRFLARMAQFMLELQNRVSKLEFQNRNATALYSNFKNPL